MLPFHVIPRLVRGTFRRTLLNREVARLVRMCMWLSRERRGPRPGSSSPGPNRHPLAPIVISWPKSSSSGLTRGSLHARTASIRSDFRAAADARVPPDPYRSGEFRRHPNLNPMPMRLVRATTVRANSLSRFAQIWVSLRLDFAPRGSHFARWHKTAAPLPKSLTVSHIRR
jgi:hypothetical protein